MLLFCRFHSIGILLFLFHATRSFVLLTANIDDVKRLASKFVSESMAEKIADFIAKATEHMITNVSDEVTIDQVSEENNRYNIARDRKESNQKTGNAGPDLSIASYEVIDTEAKPSRNVENTERINTDKHTFNRFTEKHRLDNKYNSKQNNVRFVTMKERPNAASEYIKASRDNGGKVQSKIEEGNDEPRKQFSIETNGPMNSQYIPNKPKAKPVHQLKVASTIGYAENFKEEDMKVTKKLKSRISHSRIHRSTTPKQLEEPLEQVEFGDSNKTTTDDSILRAIKDLTTKKIKEEFDQYDNINYPKPDDFIATSGPVALPKIPSNQKWLENDEEEVTKKFWF